MGMTIANTTTGNIASAGQRLSQGMTSLELVRGMLEAAFYYLLLMLL